MLAEDASQTAERELLRRAQAGHADAFGELYRRYMPGIYRFVFYRVRAEPDAEDITALVFLRAWQALPRYQERQIGLSAWLYRIARNAVIDHYRTSRSHVSLDDPLDKGLVGDDGPDAGALEEADQVWTGLGRLPEEQQTVLILRFVEGLSHAEVAEALGRSEGACRMLQHRALKALARMLGEAK
ncbi:MAG: sigma-70 family RNA polymerase sigma factor [Anaerolineae bacterium]|nr:sigma-70 family RNA polymerase sigma factor [Anaerolineae bacterium]